MIKFEVVILTQNAIMQMANSYWVVESNMVLKHVFHSQPDELDEQCTAENFRL